MKKIITIFSFLVALTFMAGPSYALVGMPDDVPGTDVLQPFFLVDMAGYDAGLGLDTLIVITDVSGADPGTAGGIEGYLHFEIFDKKSKHRGDGTKTYTPNDVVALSVRDMLKDYVGVNDLANLEYDLNGDGTNDTYVGYIDWVTSRRADFTVDNLMAQVYLVDLANGRAAGTNAPAREWAATADGYAAAQNGATNFEVFTGNALATSDYRERQDGASTPGTNNLTLTPRWFLKDATATNYLFIWTSLLRGTIANNWTWEVIVYLYDESENGISITINLPYELNIIDVREELPGSWTALGGWFEIPGTGETPTLGGGVEWLAYSYQIAESATAGLNWSGLFDVHRNIADFSTH